MKKILIGILAFAILSGCVSTNFPTTQPTFEQLVEKTKTDVYIHTKLATLGYLFTVSDEKRESSAKSLNIAATEVENALNNDIELTSIRDIVFGILAQSGDEDNKLLVEFVKSVIELIEYDLNVKLDVRIPSERLTIAKELGISATKAIKDATNIYVN